MLASIGPKEEPMVTPSICQYMTLLKLNSTDFNCCLHEFNKNFMQKGQSYKVTVIKGNSTNINSLCKGNIR